MAEWVGNLPLALTLLNQAIGTGTGTGEVLRRARGTEGPVKELDRQREALRDRCRTSAVPGGQRGAEPVLRAAERGGEAGGATAGEVGAKAHSLAAAGCLRIGGVPGGGEKGAGAGTSCARWARARCRCSARCTGCWRTSCGAARRAAAEWCVRVKRCRRRCPPMQPRPDAVATSRSVPAACGGSLGRCPRGSGTIRTSRGSVTRVVAALRWAPAALHDGFPERARGQRGGACRSSELSGRGAPGHVEGDGQPGGVASGARRRAGGADAGGEGGGVRRRVLEEDHPDTLTAMNNLA